MKKRILCLALVLICLFTTNVFAYRWVEKEGSWYVYDEKSQKFIIGMLLDTGSGVYYVNDEGKMMTGWWTHPTTGKVYFFNNQQNLNFGQMVFGLHTIDGYYRYFNDNGTLATSDKKGEYKKVYKEYWADSDGLLYFNNELMRDITIARSDYYTDKTYYTNTNLNNFYLYKNGTVKMPDTSRTTEASTSQGVSVNVATGASNGNVVDSSSRYTINEKGEKVYNNSQVSGGTDYYVNEYGKVIQPDHTGTITAAETYGPAAGSVKANEKSTVINNTTTTK